MNSEDDDAESEPPRQPRRVVRELPAGEDSGRADRLLYRIEGELNVPAFLASVGDVVERHDAWGYAAHDENPGVSARRRPYRPAFSDLVTYQRVDASSEDNFSRYVGKLAAWDARSSRSRRSGYPFRMRLLQHSPDVHVFSVAFRRVPVDVSVRKAFEDELWRCYAARLGAEHGAAVAGTEARAYWRERFAALPADPVPAPRHRAAGSGNATLEIRFRFSGEPLQRMREAARRSGTNEFVWTQCALASAVFEYCPAGAIAIWVPADSSPVGGQSGQDGAGTSLPLVVERAESPAQLVRAVTREWLSMLRVRGGDRELPRQAPAGTLRVAYVNHAQEQMNRAAGRPSAHPGGYAPAAKRETTGVHMLVQSWAEHIGVTLTFNTHWIAERSARLLAGSIESALRTWTDSPSENSRGGGESRAGSSGT